MNEKGKRSDKYVIPKIYNKIGQLREEKISKNR